MLRIYDCMCEDSTCTQIVEQFLNDDDTPEKCPVCGSEMKKIISGVSFQLKYDPKKDICAWGNEQYNTSQYWREYKAARERGEKVKPYGAD